MKYIPKVTIASIRYIIIFTVLLEIIGNFIVCFFTKYAYMERIGFDCKILFIVYTAKYDIVLYVNEFCRCGYQSFHFLTFTFINT